MLHCCWHVFRLAGWSANAINGSFRILRDYTRVESDDHELKHNPHDSVAIALGVFPYCETSYSKFILPLARCSSGANAELINSLIGV